MFLYRRAEIEDAVGIHKIATALSKEKLSTDIVNEKLSQRGFLFYPLSADNKHEPNYAERIKHSSHFWVGINEKKNVIAFMMAYTFEQLAKISKMTANDRDVLGYFIEKKHHNLRAIYISQVGTTPDFTRTGIMKNLMEKAFQNTGDSPEMIAEIALEPLANHASVRFFENMGFRLMEKRSKDNGARIAGIFQRNLS